MITLSLNGKYELRDSSGKRLEATVPGSDFGALIRAGIITDPLNASNQKEFDAAVFPVAESDHFFSRNFDLDEAVFSYAHANLICDRIDTLCICRINGKVAFESSNSHIPIDVDVRSFLKRGENTIVFEIKSPVNYIKKKQQQHALPKNPNGLDGASYIRKAACHFGWDWGPCVPYKYVGNVSLTFFNKRISNISIKQKHSSDSVRLTVNADGAEKMSLVSPSGNLIEFNGNDAVIREPQLWYPFDITGQQPPLYTLILENDEERIEKRIGLREIRLNRETDEYGSNFQLLVNGKRVFAKGANLIPFSAIPDFADNKTIDYYLDLAIKSNFNCLRVWGGGEYADEYFLSKCDELGILIWQDFAFACLMYPIYDPEFKEKVLMEAEENVRRMDLHPSLALWCGNNELEVMYSWMPKNTQLIKSYIDFFYRELPERIKHLTAVDYIPTSPLGSAPFEQNTSDFVGDTHMWNVWHGLKKLDYYQKRYTRFLSEFGLESLPSIKAIDRFVPFNQRDLSSEAFMSHQKCVGGNKKMMFYLKERFFEPLTFDYLPYMTGIVQAECIKNAVEHFRLNKGRCNGALFWQFNDVWNCPSWSAVDFEKVPKALMFHAKTFFAPVSVFYDSGCFYAVNDTLRDVRLEVSIFIDGKEKQIICNVPSDSKKVVFEYKLKKGETVTVQWLDHSTVIDNVAILRPAHFNVKRGKNKLTLVSDTYAKNICIVTDAVPSDNYFSLMPGEEKTVYFDGPVSDYRIICENNIPVRKSLIARTASRLVYSLRPENIANMFYYELN